jgi:hypothetical protein
VFECGSTDCAKYHPCHYSRWIWGLRPWKTWATYTFGTPESEVWDGRTTVGISYVRRKWLEYQSVLDYKGIGYAAVLERGAGTGRLHYHALLANGDVEVPTWRFGFSKCAGVLSQSSAYYLSKYVTKGDLDIHLTP